MTVTGEWITKGEAERRVRPLSDVGAVRAMRAAYLGDELGACVYDGDRLDEVVDEERVAAGDCRYCGPAEVSDGRWFECLSCQRQLERHSSQPI